MYRVIAFVAVVLSGCAAPPQPATGVVGEDIGLPSNLPPREFRESERVDRFKGSRTVFWTYGARPGPTTKFPQQNTGGDLRFMLAYENGRRREGMALMFSARSNDGWQYLRSHDVVLLVDGATIDPPDDHDGSTGHGYVLEHVTAVFTDQQMAAIATAERVEIRIGGLEFEIDGNALASLRVFLQRAPAPPAAGDAGADLEQDLGAMDADAGP